MKIKELVTHIASQEGKKSEVKVGDIREIVGIISDVLYADLTEGDDPQYQYKILVANGKRRAKKNSIVY